MTALEKQKTAGFLDLTADFLGSGYRSTQPDYHFEDDIEAPENTKLPENDSLEKIADEVRACRNCELCKSRRNAAPGEGVPAPLVLVIGEGPGMEEDLQGRPFVGPAGHLLDKMLAAIELSRNTNCFIANVVKCRPPYNRDPAPDETAACAFFLERQIKLLKPKFILIVGRIAAQTLLNTTDSVGKMHGKIYKYQAGGMTIPLVVTYHPAALLRNEDLKRPAWEDLKNLREQIKNEAP